MSIKTTLKLTALSALTALAYTSHAQAEGKLTVYCSVQNVVCEKVTQAFSKKYNVDAQFVRNSTGVQASYQAKLKLKKKTHKLISGLAAPLNLIFKPQSQAYLNPIVPHYKKISCRSLNL